MNRRLIFLTLCLIALVPGLVAFAPPPQSAYDISLAVSAGYNGFYRQGQWLPVRVTVSNAGDDLNGYVRVRSSRLAGFEETTYRTPLDLPQGARKQVFLYLSLENLEQEIQIEVVNQDNAVVERATASLTRAASSDILVAVITGSAIGAVDLTGKTPGVGNAFQTNWRIEDIPPLSDALTGLDVIMFHDVDTGSLRAEQIAALHQWVLSGGHLIVAGGDSWQRTTAGLADLLPVTLDQTVTIDSMAPLAAYLRQDVRAFDERMTATTSTPHPSAETLVSAGRVPIIVRGNLGSGTVDFLAVDPNAEPLRSSSITQHLWYTLFASRGQTPSWTGDFTNWSIAREATLTLFNTVLPTFFQLCGFLVLYIVLIGPVNYLVLNQLNRREWAWVTIPALILVFGIMAYRVGFNLRGNTPTVNRLSVVHVWDDSEEARVNTLIGIQSPRRKEYDIAVERGFTMRTLPEGGVGINVPVTISEGTRFVAENIPIDAGTIASFSATGTIPAPVLDTEITWRLSNTPTPHLTGRITNTTGKRLENTVLLIKGEAEPLGTLDPGETRNFDIVIGPQAVAPLTLGMSSQIYSSYLLYNYTPRMRSNCFNYSGLYLTLVDVMSNEAFVCDASVSDDQQETRRRYRLLASLITDIDYSGGRGDGVYLFGWTTEPMVDVELINQPHNVEDTTLYIFDLPVTTTATDGVIQVPPALTTWTIADQDNPSTMLDAIPDSFKLRANAYAVFQFMPLPAMQLARVEELVISYNITGPIDLAVWNWDNQEWTRLIYNEQAGMYTLSRNVARYLGPNNAVKLRISTEEPDVFNRTREFKVTYRGQLAN